MISNPGFLVRDERFSLTDDRIYYISGWLVKGAELSCLINGKAAGVAITPLTDASDERYGGVLCSACISFPGRESSVSSFALYCQDNQKKRLCLKLGKKDIAMRRGGIRYYIDESRIDPATKTCEIAGWAAAKEEVVLSVTDQKGNSLAFSVKRVPRPDAAERFFEWVVQENIGFLITVPYKEEHRILLKMSSNGENVTVSVPTTKAGQLLMDAEKLAAKAGDTIRYHGPRTFLEKSWNKLTNPAAKPVDYQKWIRRHLPTAAELEAQRNASFSYQPKISIVVPCFRTEKEGLTAMIESVLAQTYGNFELVLSDGSGMPSPIAEILEGYTKKDARIHVTSGERPLGISENTNRAIAAAQGEWIAFLDHDDLLTPDALYSFIDALQKHPDADLLYSDEDKIYADGRLGEPNFKPDFAPDFLTSVNYICHFVMVRKTVLEKAGMLHPEMDGAQDYDFLLRVTEKTQKILHIPRILYHWRVTEESTAGSAESKGYAFEAGRRAVQAHYERSGVPAIVRESAIKGIYETEYQWADKPLVSILIPSKDHRADLKKCIDSIRSKVKYDHYEILIIENNSEEAETFAYYKTLEEEENIRVIVWQGGFNYAAINNFAAAKAKGEYLLLLNNDTEMITDALTAMMGPGMRKEVGAVGARLYYSDDTVQHAGVVLGWGGVAGHAFVNQKRRETGYQHRIVCQQNYSAVTAACMLVRKSVFDAVGGFTEELAVAFNDIDLCLKIRKEGYLICYVPSAELYHFESKSRGLENTPEKKARFAKELAIFQERWGEILKQGDPYYNPNLSMITQDFSLKRN